MTTTIVENICYDKNSGYCFLLLHLERVNSFAKFLSFLNLIVKITVKEKFVDFEALKHKLHE